MEVDGWVMTSVEDLKAKSKGAIAIGPFGSRMKSDCYVPTGVPVIRGTNISDTKRFVGEMVCITPELADKLGSAIVHADDLVFPHRGAIGQVGIVPRDGFERYALSSSLMKLTCDRTKADPFYLLYYFRSAEGRHELLKNASTVGTPGIGQPLSSLRSIQIPLPPLAEQKSIARILGSLDDKIELNLRMNATLEAVARALFRSWFVDFDPVRRNSGGGEPRPEDALFPVSFEESSIGNIPKGWVVGNVIDQFNLTMGQSPPGSSYNTASDGVPLYQGRTDFGFRFPKRRVFTTEAKRMANENDTLVSVRAPVGDINRADEGCCLGRGVAAVRHKSGASSYTYYAMETLHPEFRKFEAEGTVFGSINKKDFESLILIAPPESLILEFEKFAASIDAEILNLEQQSRTLAAMRDALLPKLLSGYFTSAS